MASDGDRRPAGIGPRRSSPGSTVAAVLTALALGALLNGPGLVSAATGLDVGTTRTIAMRAATLVEGAGALLGLDRPHRWLEAVRDEGIQALGSGAASSGRSRTGATSTGEPQDDAATADSQSATTGSAPDHDLTRRSVSAEDPLEVLLIGDSLIGEVADGFGRVTAERVEINWTKDVRISTGLARPDVLHWHRHLEQQLAIHDPDVVVLMLGGNDDQSLTNAPNGVLHLGQEGWAAEYEQRVAELLTIARDSNRTVVWLALPAVRPDRLERTRPMMRAAAERAIGETEVVLLDTEPIVSPAGYSPRLDGVQVRADDGVHLTHAGGDMVAVALDRLLRDRYGLPGD